MVGKSLKIPKGNQKPKGTDATMAKEKGKTTINGLYITTLKAND
jgi:hypothetical protein